ncbi:MAG: DNA integrity scanning protein DisA nucleotide-binding domain protein [Christensenellales bacterium]
MDAFRQATEKLKGIFLDFGAADVIDIVLIAVVFYFMFKLLADNNSKKMVRWIIIYLLFGVLAVLFEFPISSGIIGLSLVLVILMIFIIYSSEIKRIIWRRNNRRPGEVGAMSDKYDCSDEELAASMEEIIKSVQNMAKKDIGALIVMVTGDAPAGILESGTELQALVTAPLLESIFFPKTPLHDGAVLIKGNRVLAAGCFLPLSQELNLPKEIGTRHRAGIGISEAHNLIAIVVSEETGIISICEGGKLLRYVDSGMLQEKLEQVYGLSLHQKHTYKRGDRKK